MGTNTCKSCGATIKPDDRTCPYCGYSRVRVETASTLTRQSEDVFTAERDKDGGMRIRFGDGQSGRIPQSGTDNIRTTYRAGAGTSGNLECNNCGSPQKVGQKTCKKCGAKLQQSRVKMTERR